MGLPIRDDGRHTYGDYVSWPDDVRYELIDGIAYLMSPAPGLRHQELVGAIHAQLFQQLAETPCRPFVAPVDVRLPKQDEVDEQIDTVVQPDVLVVCDPAKLSERGVRGAPDFIIEIISPSTARHDQATKRGVYERAGVREYWLVHPTDRILTIYRLENGEYRKPEIQELAGTTEVATLPGVTIAWDEIVARLPPIEL